MVKTRPFGLPGSQTHNIQDLYERIHISIELVQSIRNLPLSPGLATTLLSYIFKSYGEERRNFECTL